MQRTLAVPAVAMGNVGQLAVDALIASLCVPPSPPSHRIDSDPHLDPVVTLDPVFSRAVGIVGTPLEVFDVDETLSLLQIRSLVIAGHSKALAERIVGWAKEHGFSRLVIMTGASALALKDDEMFATRGTARLLSDLPELRDSRFPPCNEDQLEFSGLTKHILRAAKQASMEACALVRFVFEGDNFADGLAMAHDMITLLNREQVNIKEPAVWRTFR